jgi:DNA-binding CsgD family transcriptional regulator
MWAESAREMVQSPILVGRDDSLAAAGRQLAKTSAGAGQVLLIAGEAGIGKTRLLGAIARHAHASNFAVVRGRAFPGDLRSPAGMLLDLASDLLRASPPALSDLGRDLLSRLRVRSAVADDAHRWRRLLVQDLANLLMAIGTGPPVLMILEDLHWADELSLDVLGHAACRIAARPLLIAGTYRSDELYPKLRLRDLRARLLACPFAEEIRLPRLGLGQTATMASAVLGRPAPPRLTASIHQRSDGIPLHVEELLAAIGRDRTPPQPGPAARAVRMSAVPVSPLTARQFEVAELVAAGLTNRQIAERLVLAPKTISAHIEHMLEKLHAGRRTEIAAWYGTFRRDRPET